MSAIRAIRFFTTVLLAVTASESSARIWTHRDGRQVEADLVAAKDGSVTIRRVADGKVFQVPFAALSSSDQAFLLSGTWEGVIDGQPISLTFVPKNECRLEAKAQDGWGTFLVDWTTSPARLEIDWGKLGRIQAIIDVSDDCLKVENLNPGADRPTNFTEKAMILKRDKVKDAKKSMLRIQFSIGTYWLKHQKNPPSLQALIEDKLMTAEKLVDPWGQPYQYDPAGKQNRGSQYPVSVPGGTYMINRPDIWTVAPDKQILGNWADDTK